MSLKETQAQLRDAILRVGMRVSAGLYVYGRPGNGKTDMVRETLHQRKIAFFYEQGQANPLPLFDVMDENPNAIIVLDDCPEVTKNPRGLQILKAMLGRHRDGKRRVTYHAGKERRDVIFTGGLIAISNDAKIPEALKSRVNPFLYDLDDEEMRELLDTIVANPFHHHLGELTLSERRTVLAELVNIQDAFAADGLRLRLDARHLTHHGYEIFLASKLRIAKVEWTVALRAMLHQEAESKSSAVRHQDDLDTLRRCRAQHPKAAHCESEYRRLTGNSRATYYRHLEEIGGHEKTR